MLSAVTKAVSAPSMAAGVNEASLNCVDLLGYWVTAASVDACVDFVGRWLHRNDKTRYLVCLNPHSAWLSMRDAEFHNAIAAADLVIPDGIGVVWASRLLRTEMKNRVTGFDIFWGLSTLLQHNGGGRYFFLGSDASTLDAISREVKTQFPSIEVVGTYGPPFVDEFTETESVRMIEMVNQAKPDVLWVGLSAPKQEKWVFRNRDRIRVPVAVPVGAVFDYLARTKHRPGQTARRLGLEWLVRLSREPARLWRRTFVSAPMFAAHITATRLRSRGGRG